MRTLLAPLVLLTLIADAAGCGAVATERPIYDPEKNTIADARFVGRWTAKQGKWDMEVVRWHCSYWVRGIYPDPDTNHSQEALPVDLVRFKGRAFVFLATPPFQYFEGTLLFWCYHVEFADRGQTMRLRFLNTMALSEYLEDHPGTLKYRVIDDRPLYHSLPATRPATDPAATEPTTQRLIKNMTLTDEPKRIRNFLADHAGDGRFWSEPLVFTRAAGSQ